MTSFHEIFSHADACGVARYDVQLLISHYFQLSSAQIIARLHDPCEDVEALRRLDEAILRRRRCEPVAYIIGEVGFYGRIYGVRPGVLIPRPETELLVDIVSDLPIDMSMATIFDIGVGSGVVGLELARRYPAARIIGWDKSDVAIAVASENRQRFAHENVVYRHRDFFEDDFGSLLSEMGPTIVVSNPPYIRSSKIASLMPDVVNYEPHLALDGGDSGLVFIERLLRNMSQYAVWMGIEIGYDQGPEVVALYRHYGFSSVSKHQDFAGHDRVVTGYFSGM